MPLQSRFGQINDAVTQMDQVTQQNAAQVEQSAAAAASLKDRAARLGEVVSVFKISGAHTQRVIAQAQSTARAIDPLAKTVKSARPAPAIDKKMVSTSTGRKSDDWSAF